MPALRPKGQGVRCAGVISLRCKEISRELKKIRSQYGAVGVGAHRHLNAWHGNGRRGPARSAAHSDRERDRDEDDGDGEAAGCHGSQRLFVRMGGIAVLHPRFAVRADRSARPAREPRRRKYRACGQEYRPIPIEMSRQFLSPRGGRVSQLSGIAVAAPLAQHAAKVSGGQRADARTAKEVRECFHPSRSNVTELRCRLPSLARLWAESG
jgi:hypothetical protein